MTAHAAVLKVGRETSDESEVQGSEGAAGATLAEAAGATLAEAVGATLGEAVGPGWGSDWAADPNGHRASTEAVIVALIRARILIAYHVFHQSFRGPLSAQEVVPLPRRARHGTIA